MRSSHVRPVACALLLAMWALLVFGVRSVSLSMDEPLHIVAGYTFLARWLQRRLGMRERGEGRLTRRARSEYNPP